MTMNCSVQHRSARHLCTTNTGSLSRTNFMLNNWRRGCTSGATLRLSSNNSHIAFVFRPPRIAHATRTWARNITHTHTHSRPHTKKTPATWTSRRNLTCNAGQTDKTKSIYFSPQVSLFNAKQKSSVVASNNQGNTTLTVPQTIPPALRYSVSNSRCYFLITLSYRRYRIFYFYFF